MGSQEKIGSRGNERESQVGKMTIQDAAERIGRDMDAARLESESADTDRRLSRIHE